MPGMGSIVVMLAGVGCGPRDTEDRAGCVGPRCDPVEDTASVDTGAPQAQEDTPATLVEGGVITCADPSLRAEARYDLRLSAYYPEWKIWFWGGGLAVGDLTHDGLPDIVLPGFEGTLFYQGVPGGGFAIDEARLAGLPLTLGSGASVADYDGDGDLDLFVTRFLARDILLRNDDGVFVNVSDEAGIADATVRSMASSWGDYDGDGDLDLFVGGYGWIDESGVPHSSFAPADDAFLYANNGDGTFTDLSSTLPDAVHDGYTFAGGWHDFDGDLRPELYVVNDFGSAYPNVLMWNRGDGVLEMDGNAAGLDVEQTAMGLGINDLNGDELPDLVMPAWAGISLLESNASIGIWSEWSLNRGVRYDTERGQKIGWGADLEDLDNDGDLDMPIAFGYLESRYPAPYEQPDAMLVQQEDGTFRDEAEAWGVDMSLPGRGFVLADLNGDGLLDLVKRALNGPTGMYLSRCGPEAWLRVRLHAPAPNTFAVGARVRVAAGSDRQVRWVRSGGTNHASGGPPEVHFGLGSHDVVDRVEVTWPDGGVSVFEDVDARQVLDITRPGASG